jgi:DNA primase
VLFNLDKARAAIRQLNFALLVEGQMDCISVYMTGVQNVLATSGTAFTEHQVNLLKRYCTQVVVNFDPDTAGANAAEKSIALLTEEGFTVKVITLEDGLDPDRYIRERGAAAYHAAARSAQSLPDYLIERARQQFPPRSPEAKVKALNFLLPHIKRVPNPVARDHFARSAARQLDVESSLIMGEFKRAVDRRDVSLQGDEIAIIRRMMDGKLERAKDVDILLVMPRAERFLIQILSDQNEVGHERVREFVRANAQLVSKMRYAKLIDALAENPVLDQRNSALASEDWEVLAAVSGNPISHESHEDVEQLFAQFVNLPIRQRLRQLPTLIAEAEQKGDWGKIAELTNEKMKLDRQLRDLGQ